MSDVTRYDAVSDYEGGYLIVPADEGEYVTFEAFRAEVERLNGATQQLNGVIERLKTALRRAADEPSIDRARAIADEALK